MHSRVVFQTAEGGVRVFPADQNARRSAMDRRGQHRAEEVPDQCLSYGSAPKSEQPQACGPAQPASNHLQQGISLGRRPLAAATARRQAREGWCTGAYQAHPPPRAGGQLKLSTMATKLKARNLQSEPPSSRALPTFFVERLRPWEKSPRSCMKLGNRPQSALTCSDSHHLGLPASFHKYEMRQAIEE